MNRHIRVMTKVPSKLGSTASRSGSRSSMTGKFVLNPATKSTKITVQQARKVAREVAHKR